MCAWVQCAETAPVVLTVAGSAGRRYAAALGHAGGEVSAAAVQRARRLRRHRSVVAARQHSLVAAAGGVHAGCNALLQRQVVTFRDVGGAAALGLARRCGAARPAGGEHVAAGAPRRGAVADALALARVAQAARQLR